MKPASDPNWGTFTFVSNGELIIEDLEGKKTGSYKIIDNETIEIQKPGSEPETRKIIEILNDEMTMQVKGGRNIIYFKEDLTKSSNIPSSDEPPPPPPPSGELDDAVAGGALNEKATKLVQPAYPSAAKAVKASGAVIVQVVVDEEGRVISATAITGHPLLRAAAESAARQSLFKPTLVSGKAVKVKGTVTYNFKLD